MIQLAKANRQNLTGKKDQCTHTTGIIKELCNDYSDKRTTALNQLAKGHFTIRFSI